MSRRFESSEYVKMVEFFYAVIISGESELQRLIISRVTRLG
jgi:hypothetical protein